jgi:hypothetical protein
MNKGYRKDKNLLWIRDGNGVSFTGDPADLNPTERYMDGSYTLKVWWDSLRATRQWNLGAVDVDFTKITKNSLECMESNGNAFLWTDKTGLDRPFSTLTDAGTGQTIYFVARWDGTVNDTLFYLFGALVDRIIRVKAEGTGKLYMQWTDGTTSLFGTSANSIGAGNWFVGAMTVDHSIGKATFRFNEEAEVTSTNASFVPFTLFGATANERLYSNDTTTEKWDGGFAELIAYNDVHTSEQMLAINSWLLNKWNI